MQLAIYITTTNSNCFFAQQPPKNCNNSWSIKASNIIYIYLFLLYDFSSMNFVCHRECITFVNKKMKNVGYFRRKNLHRALEHSWLLLLVVNMVYPWPVTRSIITEKKLLFQPNSTSCSYTQHINIFSSDKLWASQICGPIEPLHPDTPAIIWPCVGLHIDAFKTCKHVTKNKQCCNTFVTEIIAYTTFLAVHRHHVPSMVIVEWAVSRGRRTNQL